MSQKQSNKAAVVIPFKKQSASSELRDFVSRLETCLLVAKQVGLRLGVYALRLKVACQGREAEDESFHKLLETIRNQLPNHLPGVRFVGQPWSDGLAIVDTSAQDCFELHQKAAALIKVVQQILSEPDGRSLPQVSLGISTYPNDGDDPETLLDRAYAASERAGGWTLSGFCFFSPLTAKKVAKRLAEEGAMLHSLRSNMVGVRYQPIIDLGSRRMVGALAKPKWCHPGANPTLDDLTHADLADAYSSWIATSVSEPHRHPGGEISQKKISVRAYRSQITSVSLVKKLSAALSHQSVSPDLVDIRFDAAILKEETDHRTRNGLRKLADLGVTLTAMNVDGTIIPVDALTTLPLAGIEFSAAMPQVIGRCAKFESKHKALIQYLRALGLRTRSIGVESEQQLTFLSNAGCDEVAGRAVSNNMSRQRRRMR